MTHFKKILFVIGLSALLWSACDSTSGAKIEGSFVNFPNDSLTLYRLNLDELTPIEVMTTNSRGHFSTKLKMKTGFPEFYYIDHQGKTLSSLLLLPGDRIYVTLDTLNHSHSVTGSPETLLMHKAEAEMAIARTRYDSLMTLFLALEPTSNEAMSLNYALGSVYVKRKQAAIRFLFSHPRSLASMLVLFQQFSDALPLFADYRDAPYFERLYDSLLPIYPNSPYITALRDQSDLRKRQMEINDKLLNAKELGFPEIIIPDVKANDVPLSSLNGNVIILSFWLSQDPVQKMANQDLLALYHKYSSKGLAIYQVALDRDKTVWARTVAEQGLPWVSVCDGYGTASSAVSLYAVSHLPTHFLINQNGELVGRDFTMEDLAVEVAKLFR